jgi:DNA-binding LacI/PurR family transcriptional regulator
LRFLAIGQDLSAGAAHLVDLLFRRIAREKTSSIILEPQLVLRQSS